MQKEERKHKSTKERKRATNFEERRRALPRKKQTTRFLNNQVGNSQNCGKKEVKSR